MDQAHTGELTVNAPGQNPAAGDPSLLAVLAVDAARQICGLNPALALLLGADPASLLHHPYDVLPTSLKQLLDDTFQANAPIAERAIPFGTEDDLLYASTTVCISKQGSPTGVVAVIDRSGFALNVGWNMQRLHRLASIGTLSASMAHEIKNALVAVNTMVEDLVQRNKDAELGGIVSRELRRIDSILSQILRFSGPGKPTFAPVNLHRVLDHCLRLVQPQLESKRIHLRRAFSARSEIVQGDDYQLEQAFLNILLNSIAAMGEAGELRVSTEITDLPLPDGSGAIKPESALRVTISDTGSGIAPENLARLFEPFFTTKAQGTGLGLAITRRIITEHRGTIDVESQLHSGTTFRVSLPSGQPVLEDR